MSFHFAFSAHYIQKHRSPVSQRRKPPSVDFLLRQKTTSYINMINGTIRHHPGLWSIQGSSANDTMKLYRNVTHTNSTNGDIMIPEAVRKLNHAIELFQLRRNGTTNMTQNDGINKHPFILLTTTSKTFINITNNWLESQRRLGINYHTTLICEDQETYEYYKPRALREDFQVLYTKDYTMDGALKEDVPHYQQLIRRRTVYVRDTLFAGYDVLLEDVDTVWLRDPVKIIRDTYDMYDLWVAPGYDPQVPCPCFMYMKSVPSVMRLAFQWVNRLTYKPAFRQYETDQNALQYILRKRLGRLRVMTLDRMQFPTGKDFFDPEWNAMNAKDVIVIHGNHLGRESNKTATFKEFGLWLI